MHLKFDKPFGISKGLASIHQITRNCVQCNPTNTLDISFRDKSIAQHANIFCFSFNNKSSPFLAKL